MISALVLCCCNTLLGSFFWLVFAFLISHLLYFLGCLQAEGYQGSWQGYQERTHGSREEYESQTGEAHLMIGLVLLVSFTLGAETQRNSPPYILHLASKPTISFLEPSQGRTSSLFQFLAVSLFSPHEAWYS